MLYWIIVACGTAGAAKCTEFGGGRGPTYMTPSGSTPLGSLVIPTTLMPLDSSFSRRAIASAFRMIPKPVGDGGSGGTGAGEGSYVIQTPQSGVVYCRYPTPPTCGGLIEGLRPPAISHRSSASPMLNAYSVVSISPTKALTWYFLASFGPSSEHSFRSCSFDSFLHSMLASSCTRAKSAALACLLASSASEVTSATSWSDAARNSPFLLRRMPLICEIQRPMPNSPMTPIMTKMMLAISIPSFFRDGPSGINSQKSHSPTSFLWSKITTNISSVTPIATSNVYRPSHGSKPLDWLSRAAMSFSKADMEPCRAEAALGSVESVQIICAVISGPAILCLLGVMLGLLSLP